MSDAPLYQVLADLVLAVHFSVVVFVLGGLVLIVVGNLRGWSWVNAWWFRLLHLGAIAVVVAEAWLGLACPLTSLEIWLRAMALTPTYSGSFIEHWVGRALYYDAPSWVFSLGYSVFGLLVVVAWWYFPPASSRADRGQDA